MVNFVSISTKNLFYAEGVTMCKKGHKKAASYLHETAFHLKVVRLNLIFLISNYLLFDNVKGLLHGIRFYR